MNSHRWPCTGRRLAQSSSCPSERGLRKAVQVTRERDPFPDHVFAFRGRCELTAARPGADQPCNIPPAGGTPHGKSRSIPASRDPNTTISSLRLTRSLGRLGRATSSPIRVKHRKSAPVTHQRLRDVADRMPAEQRRFSRSRRYTPPARAYAVERYSRWPHTGQSITERRYALTGPPLAAICDAIDEPWHDLCRTIWTRQHAQRAANSPQ